MGLPSLVDVDELKVYISVKEDVTAFDEQLLSLAKNATGLIQGFCRREFTEQEYTEQFDTRLNSNYVYDLAGNNDLGITQDTKAQRFSLQGLPVDADTLEVYYSPTREFSADNALVASEYFFNPKTNALYVFKPMGDTKGGLQVVYTAGYTSETQGSGATAWELISGAGEDLKMACITQVIFMFNKYREGNIGLIGRDRHSPEYERNPSLLCSEAQRYAMPYRKQLLGRR